MNRTKRNLLFCVVSVLIFVSLVITCFAVASDVVSRWQGGVSSSLVGAGTENDPYRISSGDDLALFARLVAEGDTFDGKYVVLDSDIDMGGNEVVDGEGKLMLYPIGFDSESSYIKDKHGVFSGIFDGQGHTIYNIYQNVEQLRGVYNDTQYNAAMGLFGHVEDATVRNLFLGNFTIGGADTDVGCVAAYASGECTFENISLVGCSSYTGDGSAAGIVGFDMAAQSGRASAFTFRNITIDASNSIGALDGSWDVHIGGLVGYLSADSSVSMTGCHTAQKLTANMSADGEYVGAGMFIGSVDRHDGALLDTSLITAEDCSVYFVDESTTEQLFAGYGFGMTPVKLGELGGIAEGSGSPYLYGKFTAEDRDVVVNTTLTLGELFNVDSSEFSVKGENIQVYIDGIGATYNKNDQDWSESTLSFSDLGSVKITICDYYFCKTTSVVVNIVEPTPVEKFALKFPNTDTYLYRVGNSGNVTLGTLFQAIEGVEINSASVVVTIDKVNDAMTVGGTYTPNTSDWTKGTILFSGTGVVRVTITDNDYCIAQTLNLEVVNAKNMTTASSATDGTDVVLLSDVKVAANSAVYYTNCTVYGNGFTYDVVGGANTQAANGTNYHGIINVTNAKVDNLVIIGEVYDKYGAYIDQEDYTAAVCATSSTIRNCYIANCSAPIRAKGSNTIEDTTLYGGTMANLILEDGTNVLRNVKTVNYNDGHGAIGFGVLVSAEATENVKLVLDGSFVQYNFVCQADGANITDTYAKSMFDTMFADTYSTYHFGTDTVYVNPGILAMTPLFDASDITDNTGNGYVGMLVSYNTGLSTVDGYLYSIPASSGKSIDNGYDADNDLHRASVQGDYLPTPSFSLGSQAVSGEDRYLRGDINGVEARYTVGEQTFTLDITTLMTVYKYNGINYTVDAQIKDADGNVVASNAAYELKTAGNYTLVFTVSDNMFYAADGTLSTKSVSRTYDVPLSLVVAEPEIVDAVITVNNASQEGSYSGFTDKTITFNPLSAITVTDNGATVDLASNVSSTSISYASSSSAFAGATTITVNYTDGRVLTIVLGKPSLNSPGSSKAITYANDGTIKSSGAVAAKSATGGTWTVTSYSFKGTNGKTVTNSTVVTYTFPDKSCVTGDTLVMLADGTQKRIDEVTYGDMLLVWNFFEGKYEAVPSAIIFNHGDDFYRVIALHFADGTTVRMINTHGFYEVESNQFVFIDEDNVDDYVGHSFIKVDGDSYSAVELIGYTMTDEYTGCYSIQSAMHNNFITEGMFSLTIPHYEGWFDYFEIGDDMKYDEEKMNADIEKYGLYTYEDFSDYVTYEQFIAFNGPYLKVLVGRGVVTYEQILGLISTFVG